VCVGGGLMAGKLGCGLGWERFGLGAAWLVRLALGWRGGECQDTLSSTKAAADPPIAYQRKPRATPPFSLPTPTPNAPQAPAQYDRIVSVEMFEHMKNYQELMRRCSSWLKPGGQLFVHIFCHQHTPYHFEVRGRWLVVWVWVSFLCA